MKPAMPKPTAAMKESMAMEIWILDIVFMLYKKLIVIMSFEKILPLITFASEMDGWCNPYRAGST